MNKLSRLSTLLNDIKDMYLSFIEIIKKERGHIIDTNIISYSEILSKKVTIAQKIEKCDKEIDELIKSIQLEYKLEHFSFNNMDKLSSLVDESERDYLFKISEVKGELKAILIKVTKENKINEELLIDRIEFANNILKIFETNSSGYSKSGVNQSRSNDGGFIDRMG